MSDTTRYSDKEAALILQRAAEMSETKTAGGLSLEELERIAVEAGLDPAAVRQAADEVARGETGSSGIGRTLLGGPTGLSYVFELEGELDDEHHEALLAVVQRNLDFPGTLNIAGRSFSWHANGQNRNLVVQVSPRNGKTEVRVEERLGNLIGGVYGGVGGGVGGSLTPFVAIGGGALFGPLGVALGVALSLGVTLIGTRAIYGTATRRRKKRLDALTADLRRTLAELLPAPAPPISDVSAPASALERARERQRLGAAAELSASDEREELDVERDVLHQRRER